MDASMNTPSISSDVKSSSLPFPLQKKAAVSINGLQTNIIITSYKDKYFVVITQLKKFGTFIQANAVSTPHSAKKLFILKTLLGKRDDEILDIYARQIIEHINSISEKSLLLSIALHDTGKDPGTFRLVLETVRELLTQLASQ